MWGGGELHREIVCKSSEMSAFESSRLESVRKKLAFFNFFFNEFWIYIRITCLQNCNSANLKIELSYRKKKSNSNIKTRNSYKIKQKIVIIIQGEAIFQSISFKRNNKTKQKLRQQARRSKAVCFTWSFLLVHMVIFVHV